jgi:prolipoprotein diacylglyceryltransferase
VAVALRVEAGGRHGWCSRPVGACPTRGYDGAGRGGVGGHAPAPGRRGSPALLVAQAIGRVGNWFNQELFGRPTELPWRLEIDPAHRPARYAADPTFHPTFLYEIIWNLSLAAALVWLGHRRGIRPPGLFALYVAGYSAFRIFEELLRVDPAHHILGLRLNFFLACTLTLAGAAWFAHSQRSPGRPTRIVAGLSPWS